MINKSASPIGPGRMFPDAKNARCPPFPTPKRRSARTNGAKPPTIKLRKAAQEAFQRKYPGPSELDPKQPEARRPGGMYPWALGPATS